MTEASTALVDGVVGDAVDDISVESIGVDEAFANTQPLAPAPTMSRAARERARRARSRRNQLYAAVAALLIGAVAALVTSPRGATRAPARPLAHGALPAATPGRAVLVVHYDRARRIDLAALVGVGARATSGSFVFLPAPTVVDVPSLELQPVSSLLRVGDRSLLVNVMENVTGVRIGQVALLDNDTLARAFAAAHSLTITFPHTVTVTDANGTLTYPAGRVAGVSPAQGVRLLIDRESGGSLVHLATVQAVLQAYFDSLRGAPAALHRAQAVRGAAPFAALARVGAMHYDVFPVSSSDAVGGERFEIRQGELDQLVRSDFGFARLGGTAPRPRVELLNGVGTAGLTQRVARIVVPAGGFVTLTNNVEGFHERKTRVVYYDDSHYATALRYVRLLGVGSVARAAITLDSVDITVVIGSDFVKAHR